MDIAAHFEDLSFSERLDKLGALLSRLKGMGERASIRGPMWRMLAARTAVYLVSTVGFAAGAIGRYDVAFVAVFVLPFLAGALLFYDVGQRGRLAYHVQRYANDEPSDPAGAAAAIRGKRGRLTLLGLLELVERKLQARARKSGLLGKVIGGLLGELLDVAGAFLVPAVVLDDVSIGEGVERVQRLKDHVPAAVVASVGFDRVAALLGAFFWTPITLAFFAAAGATVAQVVTIPQMMMALGAVALVMAVPLAALQTLREGAKSVYFTALYLMVAHPDQVVSTRADSLKGLVEMSDADPERRSPTDRAADARDDVEVGVV